MFRFWNDAYPKQVSVSCGNRMRPLLCQVSNVTISQTAVSNERRTDDCTLLILRFSLPQHSELPDMAISSQQHSG